MRLAGDVADLAEERYWQGWSTMDGLTPDGQRMFSLIWRRYYKLLQLIRKDPSRVWKAEKLRLSWGQKFCLLTPHFVPGLFRLLPDPKSRRQPAIDGGK